MYILPRALSRSTVIGHQKLQQIGCESRGRGMNGHQKLQQMNRGDGVDSTATMIKVNEFE